MSGKRFKPEHIIGMLTESQFRETQNSLSGAC